MVDNDSVVTDFAPKDNRALAIQVDVGLLSLATESCTVLECFVAVALIVAQHRCISPTLSISLNFAVNVDPASLLSRTSSSSLVSILLCPSRSVADRAFRELQNSVTSLNPGFEHPDFPTVLQEQLKAHRLVGSASACEGVGEFVRLMYALEAMGLP